MKFKQVIPMKNEAILHKIHLVYRSNYLRDTIYAKEKGPSLPKCLLFCAVNYTSEVIQLLLTSKVYLSEVVTKIINPEDTHHTRSDCLQFVHDLCTNFKQYS